jgi:hypothetical protein
MIIAVERGVVKQQASGERLPAIGAIVVALVAVSACSQPSVESLQLDRNLLTVTNQSARDWNDVEIWLNTYYRVTTASIPSGGRFQVPLDAFVAGFGQRFDFHRMQITDLRLTAKEAGGKPIEMKKQFQKSGLAGALPGKR